ncbi:alpha-ketoacid dehydrogenase kinase [Serendipita vermifera]|nr:alpha-ketoacid dehydrogenase kinase [Serendipita vermifera]
MAFRITNQLWDKIYHFASFPQTPVSLQQMVLFGQNPSQGTLLKASEFLTEELPVRLAHRVKELHDLPQGLGEMPSIIRVKEWYAQSFEELVNFPPPKIPEEYSRLLHAAAKPLPESVPNPSLHKLLPFNTQVAGQLDHSVHIMSSPSTSFFLSQSSNIAGLKGAHHPGSPHADDATPHHTGLENVPLESLEGVTSPASSYTSGAGQNGIGGKKKMRIPMERRYYSNPEENMDMDWPPEVYEYNKRFTKVLENIKKRHDPTVTTVAGGVLEWKKQQRGAGGAGARNVVIGSDIQRFLDRFYMSRIGIRFLIGQHIALNTLQPHPDYVGIICTRSRLHDIASEAIENARFICEEHYGMFKAPPVQLICPRDLTFAYVPGHLSHILFELLKNSLRAIVERYGIEPSERGGVSNGRGGEYMAAPSGQFPPIKVVVVEGNEDITIKISDEGGGIPRSAIPLVWTYMYTTMDMEARGRGGSMRGSAGSLSGGSLGSALESGKNDFAAPMAGFGYGLPLSRLVRELVHFRTSWSSILCFIVCTLFWRRPEIDLYGGVWNGRVHSLESTVEQQGTAAVMREDRT